MYFIHYQIFFVNFGMSAPDSGLVFVQTCTSSCDLPFPPDILPSVGDAVRSKNIVATPLKIGFLGLGIMGSGIVNNLLRSGHEVTVWNRTSAKVWTFFGSDISCKHCKNVADLYSDKKTIISFERNDN